MSRDAKPAKNAIMRAAQPSRVIFDPWNSCSRGHQHAENRVSGGTAWRDLRTSRLSRQFGGGVATATGVGAVGARGSEVDGGGGEERAVVGWSGGVGGSDGAGAGHGDEDGDFGPPKKKRRRICPGEAAAFALMSDNDDDEDASPAVLADYDREEAATGVHGSSDTADRAPSEPATKIFRSLTFYINGSTHPLISDHKLKRLIVAHGGSLSLGLARRKVTHVVLGQASSRSSRSGGAGGGLAGGKIQKEIRTVRGSGVKFVGVEWVLECLERGTRVPEAGFAPNIRLAGRGQRSVRDMMAGGCG